MKKSIKKQICTAAIVCSFGFAAAGVVGIISVQNGAVKAQAENITIAENYEIYAASIRYVADNDVKNGIRFSTVLENGAYQTYTQNENAELGMLIVPEDLLAGEELTANTAIAAKGITYGKGESELKIGDWKESLFEDKNGYMCNIAYLYNIPQKNYNRSLAVRAYAFDGENYVYSKTKTYSVSGVAYELIQVAENDAEKEKYSKFLNDYAVTFEGTDESISAQTVRYGEKASEPAAPDKECYIFDGWYNGETKFDFENTPITGDITLTAHYTKFAEMNLSYNGGGAWYGSVRKELDLGKEYANQTVGIEFKLNGTANAAAASGAVGIFSAKNASGEPKEYSWGSIEAAYISTFVAENPNASWNTVILYVSANAEGKIYLTGMYAASENRSAYDIYIAEYKVIGYKMSSQKINGEIYGLMAGLPTDLPAGTAVEVSLEVSTSVNSSYVSGLQTFTSVWGNYAPSDSRVILNKADFAAKGEYKQVTFLAKVIDLAKVGLISNSVLKTWDMSGNYVAICVPDCIAGDEALYRNVTIQEISAMPDAQIKSDKYAQSAAALTTDLAVDTAVTVSMDIYVTGGIVSNEWVSSSICWVENVNEYFDAVNPAKIADYAKMNENSGKWFHVEFDAVVKKFDKLAADVDVAKGWTACDMPDSNAVYIVASYFYNTTATFYYKNVTLVAKA